MPQLTTSRPYDLERFQREQRQQLFYEQACLEEAQEICLGIRSRVPFGACLSNLPNGDRAIGSGPAFTRVFWNGWEAACVTMVYELMRLSFNVRKRAAFLAWTQYDYCERVPLGESGRLLRRMGQYLARYKPEK